MKNNNDGCYSIVQVKHVLLFDAIIKLVFGTTRKVATNRYSRLVVSSKKDIQSVINFFSFSGLHPLLGL